MLRRNTSRMKPEDARVGDWYGEFYCKKDCPYFEEYKHPYYAISAWCHHLRDELGYYDGYLAGCMHDPEP